VRAVESKIEDALNEHLRHEMSSGYQYLAIAAFAQSQNLQGFAHWFHMQMREELIHMMEFFSFINDRGGEVRLGAIEEPKGDFGTPVGAFEAALAMEQSVTQQITNLYELATEQKDYPTQAFVLGFITKQVDEEAEITRLVDTLKRIGDNQSALLMLDRELAQAPDPAAGG
jgi:ferritin